MQGHDKTSNDYVNRLKTIYDGYQSYSEEFGKSAKPIMDALSGDIKEMQNYIGDYGKLLGEIRPTMMDGVKVDPSATRTREEYTGNVAAAYGKQREQLNQQMASQGMNPYANKGASRDLALSEAGARTNAANTAYKDWRSQYNQDMATKANLQGQYAGLVGQKAGMYGDIMSARSGLLGANESIMNAKLNAGQAQASGYENLLSLSENRRQEALALAQQKQENQRYKDDVSQQLNAKLTSGDKFWAAKAGGF